MSRLEIRMSAKSAGRDSGEGKNLIDLNLTNLNIPIPGCFQTKGRDRDQLLPRPGEVVQTAPVSSQGTKNKERRLDCSVQYRHMETAGRGNEKGRKGSTDKNISGIIKFFQDHAAIAEIYNSNITSRCGEVNEDISRMYKKCREITFEIHEEILKVLHELHTAMKTNHTYQSEFRQGDKTPPPSLFFLDLFQLLKYFI